MGGQVAWEDRSHRRTGRIGHIFREMSYGGGQVLRKDMSYGRTCLTGGHVLREDVSYERTCLKGGQVLFIHLTVSRSFIREYFLL